MKWAGFLFLFSIIISGLLLNPTIRKQTRNYFFNKNKEVLSQLELSRANKSYKLVKSLSPKGLTIDLYRVNNDEIMLLDHHTLTDKKDAYYKFGQQRHNLFLKDINEDGAAEIILPSLDKNMKARLNIFSFDSENEKLIKVSQH